MSIEQQSFNYNPKMLAIAKIKRALLSTIIISSILNILLIISCITVFQYTSRGTQYLWDVDNCALLAHVALIAIPTINFLLLIFTSIKLQNFKQQWKTPIPNPEHKLVKPAIIINVLPFITLFVFSFILFTFAK